MEKKSAPYSTTLFSTKGLTNPTFIVYFYRLGYVEEKTNNYQPMMPQSAKMKVTALQLAVISGQISIVDKLLCMVSTSSEQAGGETSLSLITGHETTVVFEEDIEKYGEGDRMLHGCSAFHLAARFHADSLKFFIDLFKNKSSDLHSLINDEWPGKGHPMRYSALHLAACNSSPDGLRHVYKFAFNIVADVLISLFFH